MNDLQPDHPRYVSLKLRNAVAAGVEQGITSVHGLVAHGRGEAFDYLIGERTRIFARRAARAAAAMLRLAQYPVISVNGNAAALVPEGLARLGELLGAPLEVNLFHPSRARERAIRSHLEKSGAARVLLSTRRAELDFIASNRRFVHPQGILKADVIFVPLEDGDRCEALRRMGKKVIVVDLNPLSRTARKASVTLVDNVARAVPLLLEEVGRLEEKPRAALQRIVDGYSNREQLRAALRCIRGGRKS